MSAHETSIVQGWPDYDVIEALSGDKRDRRKNIMWNRSVQTNGVLLVCIN